MKCDNCGYPYGYKDEDRFNCPNCKIILTWKDYRAHSLFRELMG